MGDQRSLVALDRVAPGSVATGAASGIPRPRPDRALSVRALSLSERGKIVPIRINVLGRQHGALHGCWPLGHRHVFELCEHPARFLE